MKHKQHSSKELTKAEQSGTQLIPGDIFGFQVSLLPEKVDYNKKINELGKRVWRPIPHEV